MATVSLEQQLYELCAGHVRRGEADCSDALANVKQQQQQSAATGSGFESLLADALSVLDLETASKAAASPERQRLLALVRRCQSHRLTVEPLLKERLTDETLEELQLIASKQAFQSRYVKLKTRLFYKQQKFNLLREENEGFAKLTVELGAMASGEQTPEATLPRLQALIGCFDLDPNRVLDLVLDACEATAERAPRLLNMVQLYRPNPADLCHLLGHKFTFYQGAPTPPGLYRVCAQAVKSGLADLRQLLPHLWPPASELEPLFARQMQEARQYAKKAVASVATDAAALDVNLDQLAVPGFRPSQQQQQGQQSGDQASQGSQSQQQSHQQQASASSASSAPTGAGDKDAAAAAASAAAGDPDAADSPDGGAGGAGAIAELLHGPVSPLFQHNQTLGLAEALLEAGDLASARSLLDRFPAHAAGGHPALARRLCAVAHASLDAAYAARCRLPACVRAHRAAAFAAAAAGPVSDDAGEALKAVAPLLAYLGPAVCLDPPLVAKLCRLGDACMALRAKAGEAATIDATVQAVFNLLDECILPSLSMSEANCPLGELIWSLVRHLPFDLRYRLYGQWKEADPANPAMVRRRAEVTGRAKYVMKRLTKDNVKLLGRQLGKLSHSNPGVLFEVVIEQICRYDNLVAPVVDSFRYLNSLGLDVLAYCVIETLADSSEDSPQLLTLSSFVGSLCKKYTFDLAGSFQYALNQLKDHRSCDLLLVREILHKMTGIEVSEEVTDDQLEAMLGGEMLRAEGGYFSQVRNTKKSSSRLKDTLMDHNLVLPFVFLLAQQRDCVIFREDSIDRHVKQCGRLYDNCQDVLIQFGNFLSLQLSTDEFVSQCPSIDQLINVYHVPADAAFFLLRSGFEHTIGQLCDRKLRAIVDNGDSKGSEASLPAADSPAGISAFIEASVEVTREVAERVRGLYPKKVWDDLNMEFFVTFWTLQCCDLEVPAEAYKRQQQAIANQLKSVEDNAATPTAKKKKERERIQALSDRLRDEERQMQLHVARVKARIAHDKDLWFQQRGATKTDTVTTFLQFCVFPRMLFTAQDAVYSAKFIYNLHAQRFSNFSTLICFDRIFNDITLPLACLTENEAHRYGRFLRCMLDVIMSWHSSPEVYRRECESFPGFNTVFRKGVEGSAANSRPDQLSYENYRHVVHKWHYRITKAFISCLEHGNYALTRNALLVMIRILPHYPRISQFGQAVERRVEMLRAKERDKRKDLEAMTISYLGQLKKRKSAWVAECDFHLKDQKTDTNGQASATATAASAASSSTTTSKKASASGAAASTAAAATAAAAAAAATTAAPASGTAGKVPTAIAGAASASAAAASAASASDAPQPDPKRRRTEHQHQHQSRPAAASSGGSGGASKRPAPSPAAASSSADSASAGGEGESGEKRKKTEAAAGEDGATGDSGSDGGGGGTVGRPAAKQQRKSSSRAPDGTASSSGGGGAGTAAGTGGGGSSSSSRVSKGKK